ncbi:sugar ABC transporter permease [Kineothrix sedimenti]|uniref:ABC transporter permease subunit n=1 Tax=Kineothrix sedimenti TaxID=3123317 RepID=A0ABZ3F0C2_9FIRM
MKLKLIALNIILILLCFLGLIPILYALSLSLSGGGGALSAELSLLPEKLTLENYRKIIVEEPFFTWLSNSVILSVATMRIAIGFAVVASYAFSRFKFKGRNGILKLLLVLNAFPQILSMFAIFRLFKTMEMLDSKIGLVVIYAGSMCIFSIWNMKGYFDTIPIEIEEASRIDGAGDFQLLWKIVLPLAMPAVVVTAVMVLISVWNEYLFATTFMMNEKSYTLAGGLYQLQSNDYGRSWPLFSAAAIMVSMPILIVFFCIQKYMVSGLTAGGVKG